MILTKRCTLQWLLMLENYRVNATICTLYQEMVFLVCALPRTSSAVMEPVFQPNIVVIEDMNVLTVLMKLNAVSMLC